jgi:hypothetical protein
MAAEKTRGRQKQSVEGIRGALRTVKNLYDWPEDLKLMPHEEVNAETGEKELVAVSLIDTSGGEFRPVLDRVSGNKAMDILAGLVATAPYHKRLPFPPKEEAEADEEAA